MNITSRDWAQDRISCAFTGHHPHKYPWRDNELDSWCITLKATLAKQIATLVEAEVTDYFTRGRGWRGL